MANRWYPIASAPSKTTVWVVDMTCPSPFPFLASFARTQFSKEVRWRIANSKSVINPTHWCEVEIPGLPNA